MLELKQINELQTVAAGALYPHLFTSALGTIGVLASLYVLQKNGVSFTQIMCHVGCAASGGIGCLCVYSTNGKNDLF